MFIGSAFFCWVIDKFVWHVTAFTGEVVFKKRFVIEGETVVMILIRGGSALNRGFGSTYYLNFPKAMGLWAKPFSSFRNSRRQSSLQRITAPPAFAMSCPLSHQDSIRIISDDTAPLSSPLYSIKSVTEKKSLFQESFEDAETMSFLSDGSWDVGFYMKVIVRLKRCGEMKRTFTQMLAGCSTGSLVKIHGPFRSEYEDTGHVKNLLKHSLLIIATGSGAFMIHEFILLIYMLHHEEKYSFPKGIKIIFSTPNSMLFKHMRFISTLIRDIENVEVKSIASMSKVKHKISRESKIDIINETTALISSNTESTDDQEGALSFEERHNLDIGRTNFETEIDSFNPEKVYMVCTYTVQELVKSICHSRGIDVHSAPVKY